MSAQPPAYSAGSSSHAGAASAARRRLRWQALFAGPRPAQGAAAAAAAVVIALYTYIAAHTYSGLGALAEAAIGLVLGAVAAALAGLLALGAIALVRLLPPLLLAAVLGGCGALLLLTVLLGGYDTLLYLGVLAMVVEAALGGAAAYIFSRGFRQAPVPKRVTAVALLILTVAANAGAAIWVASPGTAATPLELPPPAAGAALQAPNPSQPGPYEVRTLTYGSGTDRHRPEFGAEAGLKTRTVNGTPFLRETSGLRGRLRNWFWGFDARRLPLNGRVWYPAGEGPFPLVLMVHGNHSMSDFSDTGYDYLGQLLASRGYIAVSVDENFLNSSPWGGHIGKDNAARGWLLLKHLELWQDWNRSPDSPFHGLVEMDRIALVGHSRGGEAVITAAAFNQMPYYPDDATVPFDFHFSIQSVVAIAPVDGQYRPADWPVPVENVSYLVLQGAHDSDVSTFQGSRAYQRVRFSDGQYRFKAALYIYRANHGQFNTRWGDSDAGRELAFLLNRKALLDGEAQRQIARVYVPAFLDTTLRGETAYLPIFRDWRSAAAWLPQTGYITQFEDSDFRLIADYEEDADVTTASVAGAREDGDGLAVWREQELDYRNGDPQRNHAAYLGWQTAEGDQTPPNYEITLPDGLAQQWRLDARDRLVFSLASANEDPPGAPADPAAGEDAPEAPIDLTLELITADGVAAELPLSRLAPVPPPFVARFTKVGPLEGIMFGDAAEPVLQTYEFPLSAFQAINPALDPARVRTIRFEFNRSQSGVVILDRVGFAG